MGEKLKMEQVQLKGKKTKRKKNVRDLELAKSEELRAGKMEMKGHRKEKVLKERRGRKRRKYS